MNPPLTIFMAARARDLPVLELTVQRLPRNIACRAIYLVAPDPDCRRIQTRLGAAVQVVPESQFLPGMKIAELRALKVPGFPGAAGWYLQQLLKLQFAFVQPEDDFYLIWDADTVPLRPMRFVDADGKMLLTQARENHPPYFETYRRLFGSAPVPEYSFIAQHILVQKSVAREMLAQIEQRITGTDNWAWKIMRSLPESGDNLFSEYETYGNYVTRHHPERVKCIERTWLREDTTDTGCRVPTERELDRLAEKYDYVAFERANRGWRRWAKFLHGTAKHLFKRKR